MLSVQIEWLESRLFCILKLLVTVKKRSRPRHFVSHLKVCVADTHHDCNVFTFWNKFIYICVKILKSQDFISLLL